MKNSNKPFEEELNLREDKYLNAVRELHEAVYMLKISRKGMSYIMECFPRQKGVFGKFIADSAAGLEKHVEENILEHIKGKPEEAYYKAVLEELRS